MRTAREGQLSKAQIMTVSTGCFTVLVDCCSVITGAVGVGDVHQHGRGWDAYSACVRPARVQFSRELGDFALGVGPCSSRLISASELEGDPPTSHGRSGLIKVCARA